MIVAAAIRTADGKVWTLPQPARHNDLVKVIFKETGKPVHVPREDWGFVDEKGQFYRRRAAEHHARTAGQLTKPLIGGGILTSEDLW